MELTEEEKAKFTTFAKETLGYDEHAKDVIKRIQDEAKTYREAKDKLEAAVKTMEADLKKLNDVELDRQKKQKDIDDKLAADKKKLEDEKKTLDERLAELRVEITNQFTEANKTQQAELKSLQKEIKERDTKIAARDEKHVRQTIKAMAEKRGILDTDLVDYFDLKDIKIEDGEPNMEAVEKLIEDHATAKPSLYKDAAAMARDQQRDISTVFGRPLGTNTPQKAGTDFAKLSDADFEKAETALRSTRT